MIDDATYRQKLIDGGVRPEIVATLDGYDLDCVGNIVQIYRTTMREQDPSAWSIAQTRAAYLEGRFESKSSVFAPIRLVQAMIVAILAYLTFLGWQVYRLEHGMYYCSVITAEARDGEHGNYQKVTCNVSYFERQ